MHVDDDLRRYLRPLRWRDPVRQLLREYARCDEAMPPQLDRLKQLLQHELPQQDLAGR